jgi:hypothetical protein
LHKILSNERDSIGLHCGSAAAFVKTNSPGTSRMKTALGAVRPAMTFD